ncbi:hypothetical protein [Nocardioides sp. T2.26MG-1]|uniref:hypothetical protein n=1 Tax=Nocardioides sp. T2.26MG-1 TaxID=3041166 RepID=UPI002477A091|nr:hypothetical protein [Nocardioides sp. T2.26MG-1]CAI9419536.1 hypothetical protein HIDPHFAB_03741 [Nocardioides sp. T2.26MG-1]
MTADNWGALVMVLLACALVCALGAWARTARRIWAPASLLVLLAAGVVAAAPPDVAVDGRGLTALLALLAGAVAVAGGGPVTALVFDLVDRREAPADSMQTAGRVLRGGAWIGALERGAILATLVAGWPEGLAVVLAVKGLGRYPELRAAEDGVRTGAAERFIIGTFVSVLWACACAAVVVLVR